MTLLLEAPVSTSTGSTPRGWLRRNRGPLLLALALLLVLLGLVLTTGIGKSGTLDPDSYEPVGGHALATLLRDQGVTVDRVGDVPSATKDLPANATVFVSDPTLLSDEELSDLQGAGAHLVLPATFTTAVQLGLQVEVTDVLDEKTRAPGCDDPRAAAAGEVKIGGYRFTSQDPHAVLCFGDTVTLLPDQDVVLVGGAKALTNERLGDDGNAELGLQLLGQGGTVRWLVPDPQRDVLGERKPTSLGDLLPSWVHAAELWLAVTVVFLVLWRGRRLGRVVLEPLPVVVRAAETVEGRG
ncbi:MAG: hypothetical protein JWO22_1709, partial [Frankiales bacterium]|nr:hypothetical protein [Frankiales bacterium]